MGTPGNPPRSNCPVEARKPSIVSRPPLSSIPDQRMSPVASLGTTPITGGLNDTGATTTSAQACLVGSATLAAVILTDCGTLVGSGAVNNPLALIVPAVANHCTPLFDVPVISAVNCC